MITLRDRLPSATDDSTINANTAAIPRHVPAAVRNVPIVMLIAFLVFFAASPALQAQVTSSVGLGTADAFAVLAGTTITNTGTSTITGDIGLDPGTAVTGYASVVHTGDLHVDDAAAEQAKVDLVTAYNDAAGRTPPTVIGVELGGQTLTPGVYTSGSLGLTGTLTLDAQGDPNAVFIFQMASTLTTATSSSVVLANSAQACNVFWQVGSSATLGTTTSFQGNILALTSITLNTGATLAGRALARDGAVTLDTNTITRAACSGATTTTTTSTTTTTTTPGATTTTTPGDTTATTAPGDTTSTTLAPPAGGVDTGGGSSSSGAQNTILLVGGLALLAAGVGAFGVRRRLHDRRLN